ncbi:hypothetical protein H7J74_16505 [Mycobacterium angelicum]|nr:hypothetical protein [Mycobacterium angelicum]MCV7198069.1 hypothetical protein [Mycobacterium angelicum]
MAADVVALSVDADVPAAVVPAAEVPAAVVPEADVPEADVPEAVVLVELVLPAMFDVFAVLEPAVAALVVLVLAVGFTSLADAGVVVLAAVGLAGLLPLPAVLVAFSVVVWVPPEAPAVPVPPAPKNRARVCNGAALTTSAISYKPAPVVKAWTNRE